MNTGKIISDQKISTAHLAILFAFLLGIVSKDSISNHLTNAIIIISAAVPFLALSIILYQLQRVTESKPLHRIYFLCFGLGNFLGALSLTCIFYSASKIAGITFIVLSLLLAVIVGPILEKADPTKAIKNNEND